jgi:hypothetical protein
VVVEEGKDLDVGARLVVEPVVGEVRLPALVGQVRFEADVGRAGSLLRLRGHEPLAHEQPVDRRDRDVRGVLLSEGPSDRLRPCVEATLLEVRSDLDHERDHLAWERRRRALRPSRPRLEGRLSLRAVAGDESADPGLRDAVGEGDLGLAASLDDDGSDDKAGFGHPRSSSKGYAHLPRQAMLMS